MQLKQGGKPNLEEWLAEEVPEFLTKTLNTSVPDVAGSRSHSMDNSYERRLPWHFSVIREQALLQREERADQIICRWTELSYLRVLDRKKTRPTLGCI